MPEDAFYGVRNLLDRYYEAVSNAQIDFEVETGLVSEDGFRLVRRAVSHVANHISNDDENELRKAGQCLCEAILTYRSQLYTAKAERAIQLLRDIMDGKLEELANPDELTSFDNARKKVKDILSREGRLSNSDWETASGVYTDMIKDLEDVADDLDDLLVRLRTRGLES